MYQKHVNIAMSCDCSSAMAKCPSSSNVGFQYSLDVPFQTETEKEVFIAGLNQVMTYFCQLKSRQGMPVEAVMACIAATQQQMLPPL